MCQREKKKEGRKKIRHWMFERISSKMSGRHTILRDMGMCVGGGIIIWSATCTSLSQQSFVTEAGIEDRRQAMVFSEAKSRGTRVSLGLKYFTRYLVYIIKNCRIIRKCQQHLKTTRRKSHHM